MSQYIIYYYNIIVYYILYKYYIIHTILDLHATYYQGSLCLYNPKREYCLFWLLEKYKFSCFIGNRNVYQLICKCKCSITTYKIIFRTVEFYLSRYKLGHICDLRKSYKFCTSYN